MNTSYLYTPVQTIVDPPIDTTNQELPLEKLSWEDFEKLCLAIVEIEFSINNCEIYGIKGQKQSGIDILARQANDRYSVYQAKRYQNFKLVDLNSAVSQFKKGKFFNLSDKLYLCTSCEWNKIQVQEKFEILKTELKKDNITLVKWDKVQLQKILKNQPQIVFDFFGEVWVKKFNGESALQQLSKSKKLDAKQIAKFRKELYEFYSTIFNIQDPGIPIKELNCPYTLQDRFIIPDILSNVKEEGFEPTKENFTSIANNDQYYYEDYWYGQSEYGFRSRALYNHSEVEENSIDIRIQIDEALAGGSRNIIIGDPGAGKSTLLRYITLDILNANPSLENISHKYGKTLPVWLPFAFITKHLSQNDSLSISEILNLWFNGFGKNYLFDLAKDALEDERLFLIIDGIDEWSSFSSAQQVITRIESLRGIYECKVLYSSRPYGFKMLKDFFTNLNVLNLAGFSKSQQKKFVENWYNKWASLQKEIKDKDFSKNQTNNFVKELEQAGDLKKLAEVPLLLSILVLQKMQDSILPKNKLEALKQITHYLIKKHPVIRVSSAGIIQEETSDIDFKDIFCELAINIQKECNDGVILKSEAQKIIEQYLITYAEYDKVKAKIQSQKLIEVGANNFGLIIEKSNDEIAFGHKQFQEFLAAQQLHESDEDLANQFIIEYAANPAFHQVIISFFGLIPLKQVKKYKKHFDALKGAIREKFQEDYLKLISYEVAINLDNSPSEIMTEAFDSIVSDFEYETDPVYKEALLRRILEALQNGRLKEKVQNFLIQYFPNQFNFRDYRINALCDLEELNELQLEFLKKAFINGNIELRHDASYAFLKHIKNKNVFKFIKDIILNCSNPNILAFAINSLITKDIEDLERKNLIESIEVDVPIVQLYLLKNKVFEKKLSIDDLEFVLSVINQLPYQLEKEFIDILVNGFGNEIILKEKLIKSTKEEFYNESKFGINNDISWTVLFRSFNNDPDVINLIKSQFENNDFPFSINRQELFEDLILYFKNETDLIPTVDKWLENNFKKYNHVEPEAAILSIFTQSDNAKNILLKDLPMASYSHWNVMALLEGWPNDPEIKEKLKDYFRNIDTSKTSKSAHYISKVFDSNEKDEAIKILEQILFDKKIIFRERAILSLIEVDKEYFETKILKRLIEELETFDKETWGHYYSALYSIVNNFQANEAVQTYVLERLKNDSHLYGISVLNFPELINNEKELLKKSSPLSKELKLLIIEAFADLSILPNNIENVLSNFGIEAEEEIMADMAICLFNHIKENNSPKIIELCKPLVFATGFYNTIMRNIAFTGFLISKKLDDYFLLVDSEKTKISNPQRLNIFNDFSYRKSFSGLMTQSLIDNFDYLVFKTGKDFKLIVQDLKNDDDIENIWGFFAKYSVRSSPTYPYLIDFISKNASRINNNSIINFLSRTSSRSPILKDILLKLINNNEKGNRILVGKILGTNFKTDTHAFNEAIKVKDIYDNGRIVALCKGWPQELILKEVYEKINNNSDKVNHYVTFNLKFLFQDVDNIIAFLKSLFLNNSNVKHFHKYFFIPMMERLKRDKEFGLAIKALLLSANTINEKISYYNLLTQANMVDEEIILWKKKITDFKNDFGYDIVSNKTVRLKDVIYDYYF